MKRGEEKMSTDLSSFRETSFGKMPTTMRDAWTLATMLAKSSLVPKAYIGMWITTQDITDHGIMDEEGTRYEYIPAAIVEEMPDVCLTAPEAQG
jgi:hypothetical protein